MSETTMQTGGDDERLDPRELARQMAIEAAEDAEGVGDFVSAVETEEGVTDFRFDSLLRGYEGWQWSVTMFHDTECDRWTVNESTLIPTDRALQPPPWVPWRDRLLPTDLSVTDSIGTQPDDPRLESGVTQDDIASLTQGGDSKETDSDESAAEPDSVSTDMSAAQVRQTADEPETNGDVASDASASGTAEDGTAEDGIAIDDAVNDDDATRDDAARDDVTGNDVADENTTDDSGVESGDSAENAADMATAVAQASSTEQSSTSQEDIEDTVSEFDLSRRHVLSPLGRAQTAKRWYEGPRGPKSLSTKIAAGNLCSTCGFFVPIKGELGDMFGVCANKWSPDDGKVVSLDHGCGEHSEIEPPQPSHIWVQSKPAFDDFHIDIVAQAPREERSDVELIEQVGVSSRKRRRKRADAANGIILLKSQLPID